MSRFGPPFNRKSVSIGPVPSRFKRGFRFPRTQNRKPAAPRPIITVTQLIPSRCAKSDASISGRVWPWALTPRMCLSWLVAIRIPEAVIKPAITGWLRKFARNPRRSTPSRTKNPPDRNARVSAATAYPAVPCSAT